MIPRETLHHLAKHFHSIAKDRMHTPIKHLQSLAKVLCYSEKLCVCWQNIYVLKQNFFSGKHKSFAKEHKIFQITFPPFSFFPIITTGSFELVFDVSTCSVWPSPRGFRVYKRSDDSFLSTIPIRHPGPRTL